MIDPAVESLFSQDDSGLLIPTKIRRAIHPWDELKVLNPPEEYLTVNPNLLSALSILVAQNNNKPTMLNADFMHGLRTATRISPAVNVVAIPNDGIFTITVDDASGLVAGDQVLYLSHSVPNVTNSQWQSIERIDYPTGRLRAFCVPGSNGTCTNITPVVGDTIILYPKVLVESSDSSVEVGGPLQSTSPENFFTSDGAVARRATFDNRSQLLVRDVSAYTRQYLAAPGAGSQATVNSVPDALTGRRHITGHISGSVKNLSGAAITTSLRIFDQTAVGGTLIWLLYFDVPNNGTVRHYDSQIRLFSSSGNGLAMQWDAPPAGVTQSCNMGVYMEQS
jgi:hypothetical protein